MNITTTYSQIKSYYLSKYNLNYSNYNTNKTN